MMYVPMYHHLIMLEALLNCQLTFLSNRKQVIKLQQQTATMLGEEYSSGLAVLNQLVS